MLDPKFISKQVKRHTGIASRADAALKKIPDGHRYNMQRSALRIKRDTALSTRAYYLDLRIEKAAA